MARALEIDEIGTVVSGNKINNLKFADDIGLSADSPAVVQSLICRTEVESKRFSMTVSTVKTEVQSIPSEDQPIQLCIQG